MLLMLEIKNRWHREYEAEDGLGRLDLKDSIINPYNALKTVRNDNGILFRAVFLAMVKTYLIEPDAIKSYELIKSLEVKPGVYNRKPGWAYDYEQHDNYLGILLLCAIQDLPFKRDILKYGEITGFVYNNKEPGTFVLKCQRHPVDVVLYKIVNGQRPAIWSLFYFVGHFVYTMFFNYKNVSDMQVNWVRLEILDNDKDVGEFYKSIAGICRLFFNIALARRFGDILGVFKAYYSRPGEYHPIIEAEEYLKKDPE